jgi:cell division protein FtsQ
MRFLTARAEKRAKPAAARARRARRWTRGQRLVATGSALLLAIVGGSWGLERSGAIAAVGRSAENAFFAVTAELGLRVKDVEVEGREHASRTAILDALEVDRGTPILAVDPYAAKERLESIAWVRAASVERRLPDTLFIHLVERQPLAYWQRDGKLVLIDRDGVVVPTDHLDSFGNLPVLVGADAPQAGGALLDMLATEPTLAPRVAAAVRIGGRRWTLHFDNGVDVALPEDNAAAAWHRLAALEHGDGILERAIEQVDMRLPDRLTIRVAPSEMPKTPAKKGHQPGKTT